MMSFHEIGLTSSRPGSSPLQGRETCRSSPAGHVGRREADSNRTLMEYGEHSRKIGWPVTRNPVFPIDDGLMNVRIGSKVAMSTCVNDPACYEASGRVFDPLGQVFHNPPKSM